MRRSIATERGGLRQRAAVRAGALGLLAALCTVPLAFGQPEAQPVAADPLWAEPDTVAARGPWPARRRTGVRVLPESLLPHEGLALMPGALAQQRLRALGLRGGPRTHIAPDSWPAEPAAPVRVDPDVFAFAMRCLCPEEIPDAAVTRIARAALDAAATYGVDPFVLGALAFHQSHCAAGSSDSYGIGLTRINLGMHAGHVRAGAYHYARPLSGGGYVREQLPLHGHTFSARALREPESNLHFTAAFLRAFEAQCPAIDRPFGSAPHRHAISHVVFGDHVRSALPEALVLTARRRLLGYYGEQRGAQCTSCERALRPLQAPVPASASSPPAALVSPPPDASYPASPLDGAPRIVIGVLGDPRDRGTRPHAGIDLLASEGEPVRAIQSGVVISAGVELRGQGLIDLPPERALAVPLGRMGARGRFVRIAHAHGWVSIYAHLSRYTVRVGERVARGQLLGRVGRTGVHTSGAHLHFGLFEQDRVLDPLSVLRVYVLPVPPDAPAGPALGHSAARARRIPASKNAALLPNR